MIYTLGEALLDIIFSSDTEIVAKPGGSMLNVAVSLGRSGAEVSLISEVGDDQTAEKILDFLKSNKVHSKYIKKYYRQNTTVALAFLDANKKADFSIHKSYPEKRHLVVPGQFAKTDIVLFGSLYSLFPAIREELKHLLMQAKNDGALLIYDPNIRKHRLDIPAIREALLQNLRMAHIIKASDEDLIQMFGEASEQDYLSQIRKLNADALFIMTRGENGVSAFTPGLKIEMPANRIKPVSTIGAGDAFNAGMAWWLVQKKLNVHDLKNMAENDFAEMLQSGQDFASEVCQTMDNYVGFGFRE